MTTVTREQAEKLAKQNLLGIFGERDAAKCLAQMEATYAPDITFHEPDKTSSGFDAVNNIVSQLLEDSPGWIFQLVGKLWVNRNLVTQEWEFGPEGEAVPVRGNDIMFVNEDGKIERMYTMIQGVSDVDVV